MVDPIPSGGESDGSVAAAYLGGYECPSCSIHRSNISITRTLSGTKDCDLEHSSKPGSLFEKVFVSNLAYEVGWQDLKDHMRNAGNVLRADVFVGNDGRSKGLGTVEFSKPYEVRTAVFSVECMRWCDFLLIYGSTSKLERLHSFDADVL